MSYVGQDTTLPCRPTFIKGKDVDWKYRTTEDRAEDYVYSNGVMYERFADRFAVVKSDDGDYDLKISNISSSDAGLYICVEDMGYGERHIYDLVVSGNLVLLTYRYCNHFVMNDDSDNDYYDKSKKTTFIETVIGDVVAHLKSQKFTIFRHHICNVLFHHYSASSVLLST